MATIKEVAKYANVSVATVSRVLNNKGYVGKESKVAVDEAIKALNYKPNSVARSLYHKSSKMIGLLIPDISNPFFPELARAVEDVALTYGYTVVICNTDEDVKKERQYIDALMQKYIDGLILTTNHLSAEDYEQLEIPLVALDRIISDKIPTVVADNYQGAKEATNHLISTGCSFILHIRGPSGVYPADQRYEGFKSTVEEKGIASLIIESGFNIGEAEEAVYDILKKYPQIDGVFASSDVMAAGAMKAAGRLGIRIPDELQLIGFDGIPLGEMLVPSLTTIAQPIYEMGAMSARLLIKQIEKISLEDYHYKLDTSLVVRQTTRSETDEKA